MKKFEKIDAAIVGCSADSVETQAKFKTRHKLNFTLLADPDFKAIEAYGARRMKQFLGKSFLGIVRTTFWIGADGHIRRVWDNVSIKGHAADVLKAIEEA
jgi:thioredoxin-dependent peroxiredoxin